jgi:hypothetical protein
MITSPTNEGPHAYIAITGYIAASEVDGKIYNDLSLERQKALSDILVSLGIPATLITCHLQDPMFARQTKDPDSTKDRRAEATLSHFAQKPCPWSYRNRLE